MQINPCFNNKGTLWQWQFSASTIIWKRSVTYNWKLNIGTITEQEIRHKFANLPFAMHSKKHSITQIGKIVPNLLFYYQANIF